MLLSSVAQRKLGLVIDMGAGTIYSKVLDLELEVVNYNGLPGIRLHPGNFEVGSIALTANEILEENIKEDEIEEKPKKVEASQHFPIQEGNVRYLNKGKKKQLQEAVFEVEQEDCALWSTITEDLKRPIRSSYHEAVVPFSWTSLPGQQLRATWQCRWVLPSPQPVDVIYDPTFDLTKEEKSPELREGDR